MKNKTTKLFLILVLGSLVLPALIFKGSMFSQSYWERRQKAQEKLRKEQLGTPVEKPAPAEESAPEPETEAEEELLLPPDDELLEEESAETEDAPWQIPMSYLGLMGLGDKEITKIADKNTHLDPNKIKVSETYGTVKEAHVAKGSENPPLIIHIQDAHANYDAQVSIAHLVEDLLADYGINLVCTEGSYINDTKLTRFRMSASQDKKVEVASKKLREGTFDGVEYLYAVTGYSLDTRGIEDKDAYYDNINEYFAIDELRPSTREFLDSLKANLTNLQSVIFSRDLNEMEDNKINYNSENISLTDYCKFLSRKSEELKVEIQPNYKNLALLSETIELEEKIDFPGVDTERGDYIDSLRKKLSKSDAKKLDDNLDKFRTGDMKASEFYGYLTSLQTSDLSEKYPNMVLYSKYIKTFDNIDTYELFKEIDNLEKELKTKMYQNDDQKEFDKMLTDFKILREFVELGLTPEEYSYYMLNRENMDPGKWVKYIKKKQKEHGLNKNIPKNISAAQKIIPKLEKFYKLAILRDKILVERTIDHIKNSDSNTAIMVCGGFHTPRITGMMRTLDISYVVIAPKITNPTQPGLYDKVLKQQKENREQRR